MNATELLELVINNLEEHKALDIVKIDMHKSTIADYMVICSGTSNRHVNAIGDYLVEAAKHAGVQPLGVEEDPDGSWTLVDLGDIIVHIMLPQTREHYDLEKLWGAELAAKNRKHVT